MNDYIFTMRAKCRNCTYFIDNCNYKDTNKDKEGICRCEPIYVDIKEDNFCRHFLVDIERQRAWENFEKIEREIRIQELLEIGCKKCNR